VPWVIRRRYALPYEVCEIDDYEVRYRVAVRLAMAQSVSIIATPNPATLIRLAEVGRAEGAEFIRHIREGTLGVDGQGLPEDEQAILRGIAEGLQPQPKRAEELQRLLDEHGELLPRYYWSELAVIGCWLGGSAGVQATVLSDYYGDVPLRDLGFRSTECTFTLPLYDGSPDGVLTLHANFFEFIPVDEIDDPEPTCLMAHEVEEGQQYYIITTTLGGLYRYDINDIVEVTARYRNAPTIRFIRKGRDMVSIIGEKLHVNQLLEAASEATDQTGVAWSQFRFIPDADASRYDMLFEPTRSDTGDEELKRFVHAFDQSLCEVNVEYPTKRNSGRLHLPRLFVMNAGWSERVIRTDVIEQGRRDSQYKWNYIQQSWDERTRAEVARQVETDT
ncbi:MAG: GH3 auxin-responsive promoter family protein, partial [Myxococcota bacterium]|nr:GH3 auxin-responsive promoter family protein [Myxococcota bacterium]